MRKATKKTPRPIDVVKNFNQIAARVRREGIAAFRVQPKKKRGR